MSTEESFFTEKILQISRQDSQSTSFFTSMETSAFSVFLHFHLGLLVKEQMKCELTQFCMPCTVLSNIKTQTGLETTL